MKKLFNGSKFLKNKRCRSSTIIKARVKFSSLPIHNPSGHPFIGKNAYAIFPISISETRYDMMYRGL